jgi:hypothetical protein
MPRPGIQACVKLGVCREGAELERRHRMLFLRMTRDFLELL